MRANTFYTQLWNIHSCQYVLMNLALTRACRSLHTFRFSLMSFAVILSLSVTICNELDSAERRGKMVRGRKGECHRRLSVRDDGCCRSGTMGRREVRNVTRERERERERGLCTQSVRQSDTPLIYRAMKWWNSACSFTTTISLSFQQPQQNVGPVDWS